MNRKLSRRSALGRVAAGAVVATTANLAVAEPQADPAAVPRRKGNIRHSACKWCYGKLSTAQLARAGRELGLVALDLIDPPDFPVLKEHGLVCSMVNGPSVEGLGGITRAFNRLEHHDKLVPAYAQRIKEAADHGYERVICFSGNRDGLPDEQGLENCAIGLRRLVGVAERHRVTLCMELLNSKRDHHDYQCDHSAWGVELVKRVGSERFKLLYDIYHMQIMEGDVCATIREHHAYFDHYHTGGVPGRAEIDDSQELYYPRIMQAILATGFKGYVAQEFIPRRDPLTSLRQAIQLCDV
ncbi:MAG TPA: TIM barrel protein [Verrucomicrobiota bacterium]|nr:TIM barrel protein [Verrucomicrobiota bacterium]HNT15904.1 TIM barrel protein [Verrucomicrobiota bacterium]